MLGNNHVKTTAYIFFSFFFFFKEGYGHQDIETRAVSSRNGYRSAINGCLLVREIKDNQAVILATSSSAILLATEVGISGPADHYNQDRYLVLS